MQFTTLALMTAVTSVMAAPQRNPVHVEFPPPGFNQKFGVNATGEGIINIDLRAMNGHLFIGGPQKATCPDSFNADFATFIGDSDHTWKLYNTGKPTYQLYVDHYGSVGYTTGDVDAPPHTARAPFYIDPESGYVNFDGLPARACPTGAEKGQYSLWFSTLDNPPAQKNCVAVTLQAYKAEFRPSCTYL